MRIQLHEKNNWSYVYAENPTWTAQTLTALLTPRLEGGEVAPWSNYDPEHARFPRGFTPLVAHHLYQVGCHVQWTKEEQPLRNPNHTPPTGELRHLQGWVVEEMAKHDYGVLDIATRFGKSYVYAGWYVRMGRPMTLITVPRAAIAQQMRDELAGWLGEPVGIIAGSVQKEHVWQNLTIAIEDSLCQTDALIRPQHIPYLHAVEARIRDECHLWSIRAVPLIMAMPWCKYAWGGSATPWTDDPLHNWELQGWYGDARIRVSSKLLADRGILAPVDAHFHRFGHTQGDGLDWMTLYKSQVVNNTERNAFIAKLAQYEMAQGRQGLIFINHVAQAKNLLPNIPNAKIVASKLLSHKEAEQIKRDFNERSVDCVIVTKKWREGVTLAADFGINAEGGKAEHVLIQKLGRGLLPKVDGAKFRWHEILDSGHSLLAKHASARRRTVLREEWDGVTHESFAAFERADRDQVMRLMLEIQQEQEAYG